MIYFYGELIYEAEKYIHNAYELYDIRQDMEKIEYAERNIYSAGGIQYAHKLDEELRKKYPTIDMMIDVANSLPKTYENQLGDKKGNRPLELDILQQDWCGIICDVLLKKEVVESLEQCIRKVTE